MYKTEGLWFNDDIRKVRGWELPNTTIWTFGFPCQDVSIAGKQRGIKRGTRSGLFYEIMRLIDESEANKPQLLVCENVRNLLSIEGGRGMLFVLSEMDKRGYDAEWKVYNSKDYGVPQNRERVYIVGHLRTNSRREVLPVRRENATAVKQVGNIVDTNSFGGNPQRGRVYSLSGISPCLNTCQGGGLEPKVLCSFGDLSNKSTKLTINSRALISRYTAGITNHAGVNSGVLISDAVDNGDGIDLNYPNSTTRGGRIKKQVSHTLITQSKAGVIFKDNNLKIRRLTPRECWRLQGFTDEQFNAAQAVNSDTQLYKQAGNAVTVNVVYEIGKSIMNSYNQ